MILKPTTYRDKIKKEINFYKENKNKFEQFMAEDNESAIIMYFHGWINIIKKNIHIIAIKFIRGNKRRIKHL